MGSKAIFHHLVLLMRMTLPFLPAACWAAAIPMDPYLKDAAETWTRSPSNWVEGETEAWFSPVTTATNAALRYPGYSNSPELTFLDFKVYEIQLQFEGPVMRSASLSLYNRGDAGEISKNDFKAQVAAVDQALTIWAGQRGALQPTPKLAANILAQSKRWVLTNQTAELKWSASRHAVLGAVPADPAAETTRGFRTEYIQVLILPAARGQIAKPSGMDSSGPSLAGSAGRIRQNVNKEADGTVIIENVPMVDQGQRGYCAVATAERLLRYYGRSIDQDALAQLVDARTGGGTDTATMLAALNRVGLKFGVTIKTHVNFNAKAFLDLVDKYNQQARKEGAPAIKAVEDNVIQVDHIYDRMDAGILRRTRCERGMAGLKNFTAEVIKSVDQGIPLAWSVRLGLVKETADTRQEGGGHMRIILGYNKASKALLYSDSWGAGHERNPMSFEDAWTITTGLYSLNPRY